MTDAAIRRARTRLRGILDRRDALPAPGAFDAISAALIERAGFQVMSMTGAGVSCSLGYPDLGLVTMSEVVDRLRSVVRGTSLPVIADADTGYGGVINVRRTVEEFERAGAAAIHIEDQVSPKRCGLLDRIEVVPTEEMIAKIGAAVDAREDPDFVLIARSDARAAEEIDEVIARANAYARAGADAIFLFDLRSEEELARAAREVEAPLITHVSRGAKIRPLHPNVLAEFGYAIALFPLTVLQMSCKAMEDALAHMAATGTIEPLFPRMWTGRQIYELIGLEEAEEFERSHARMAAPVA